MTVVETPTFLREAASSLSDHERSELISFLAANPDAGDLMAGTGGLLKLRWGALGKGKRGGVRVVYYYHSETLPLFLLNVLAKNEKANLTNAERNELRQLLPLLVAGYRRKVSR
ncbi:MAG TPA: addiction module toxin RelE [Solibacterales bacterium]|nr:addiction module toxin RelE [Bryobacterales bacterium]